jgi:heptosyltransferase III
LKRIILSRTDSIGDVMLTLPMAGVLKKYIPGCHIIFLGRSYTKPIIECSENVDQFIDWDEIQMPDSRCRIEDLHADIIVHVFPDRKICKLAKQAGIPLRIATSHRWFTALYCNELLRFGRMNSDLHEAQLNLKMLAPLGITDEFPLNEIPIFYGLTKLYSDRASSIEHRVSSSLNLILHPKSKGSAREWGLDNFSHLIDLLPKVKFRIFITGTKEDGLLMKDFLEKNKARVTDLTGKLTLSELISFIAACDGLIAASTGPLHIAAALGKHALGLYAPMKPIYPKRWAPLGKNADYLVFEKEGCTDCKRSADCTCIRSIKPEDVLEKLVNW